MEFELLAIISRSTLYGTTRDDLPNDISNSVIQSNIDPVQSSTSAGIISAQTPKYNPDAVLSFVGGITVVKGPPRADGFCDAGAVLNLTESIKIITGPLRAGGFCDIYAGELTSVRGAEAVAMKMLRIFNTEEDVLEGKKVCATTTLHFPPPSQC
jgi:hypothetical protein